ncbi:ERCC1 [Scenedesmus sp. PABB004]|nr:ERCC1 [Scenedesmus sp. PABB004]
MGDWDFLDDAPPRAGGRAPRRQRPQQQQHVQQPAAAPPGGAAGGDQGTAAAAAAAGARPRIALPSLRQVEAAQRSSATLNAFTPGLLTRVAEQQQQQQQQQAAAAAQQQAQAAAAARAAQQQAAAAAAASAAVAGAAISNAASAAAFGAAPPLGVALQLPRFGQGAAPHAPPAPRAPAPAPAPPPHGAAAPGGQGVPPSNAVLVSARQQGNPVLKALRGVRWAFADIVPDFQCGPGTGVIFLSLRYHLLQPEYVLHRLRAVQRGFRLAVLLLLVDTEEVVKPLAELHRAALGADAALICAWSNEECARYIETLKAYEGRPAGGIMERTDPDYLGRLSGALGCVRGVNRADAAMLASRFGSLAEILTAEVEQLTACPGLGPVKARRLLEAFRQPFKRSLAAPGGSQQQPGGSQQQAGGSQQQPQQQPQQQAQEQQGGGGAAPAAVLQGEPLDGDVGDGGAEGSEEDWEGDGGDGEGWQADGDDEGWEADKGDAAAASGAAGGAAGEAELLPPLRGGGMVEEADLDFDIDDELLEAF